jgi:ABC-type transporter MlaC component
MMKVLLYSMVSLLLVYQSATAQNQPSAEQVLKENLAAVFAVLQKQDLSQEAKNNQIIEIVNPMFDFFPDGKADFGEKILARSDPGAKRKFYSAFYQTLKDFVSGSTDPVHR